MVLGATGLVGQALVRQLLADSRFIVVKALVRRSLSIQHPKLVEIEFSELSQIFSLEGVSKGDIFFCCLGTTLKKSGSRENFYKVDFHGVSQFVRMAQSSARCMVLVSASGANPKSKIFYNRVKGETENILSQSSIPSKVIFRPALLIGKRTEHRWAESLFIRIALFLKPFLPQFVRNKMMTDVDRLAHRMIQEGFRSQVGFQVILAQDI